MLREQIAKTPWAKFLETEMMLPYFAALDEQVCAAYQRESVCPAREHVLRVLLTAPKDVKAVIIGQDPYYTKGQAMGLSFSLKPGATLQPSLAKIFLELKREDATFNEQDGDLTGWQRQGVFLLNTLLTVREGTPESHDKLGWQKFTDALCRIIDRESPGAVWMLWGKKAQQKQTWINRSKPGKHSILSCPHPSPQATGFLGNNHFGRCNDWLKARGRTPIVWKWHKATMVKTIETKVPVFDAPCCMFCTFSDMWNLFELVDDDEPVIKRAKK